MNMWVVGGIKFFRFFAQSVNPSLILTLKIIRQEKKNSPNNKGRFKEIKIKQKKNDKLNVNVMSTIYTR